MAIQKELEALKKEKKSNDQKAQQLAKMYKDVQVERKKEKKHVCGVKHASGPKRM